MTVLAAAIALGIAVGAVAFPVAAPTSIAGSTVALTEPVSTESMTDPISVNLTVTTTPATSITTSLGGTVTSSSCSVGAGIQSGTVIASINDQPLIALATSEPFWRDIAPGDSGPDVIRLENALRALGYSVSPTSTFVPAGLRAVVALATKLGDQAAAHWTAFPASQFVWIPAAQVQPTSCALQPGSLVTAGSTVATLPGRVETAGLESIPSTAVPGARVLKIGDLELPVSDDGQIVGEANLTALAGSSAYRDYVNSQASSQSGASGTTSSSSSGTSAGTTSGAGNELSGTFQLAAPVRVIALSPAALYDQNGAGACVMSDHRAVPVTVVGSQLGQSLVTTAAGQSLSRVTLSPTDPAPCR